MTRNASIIKTVVVKKRSATGEAPKAETVAKKPQGFKKPFKGKGGNQNQRNQGPGKKFNKGKAPAKNRVENITYTDEKLDSMTRDELNKLALAQSDEVARITNQLDQAKALHKATGAKLDAKWLGQATCAKRIKQNLLSRIYLTINKKKKEQNVLKGQNFERTFMVMAESLLSESQFKEILDATRVEVALKAA